MNYGVFSFKLLLLSIPFLFGGILLHPFVPTISIGLASVISLASIIFGFYIMVMGNDNEDDPKSMKFLITVGKIIFLFASLFSIAGLYNLDESEQGLVRIFNIPLSLLGAKIFFRVNLSEDL